jgi:hypothetical protein
MSDRGAEPARADQRWVRSQHFVLNAVFAALMGALLLCCGSGVALWLLVARAADRSAPPAGPVDTRGEKQ